MTDDELRQAYAALRQQRQQRKGDTPTDPSALWEALAGDLTPDARARILDEALQAGASDDLALVQAAHAAAASTDAHDRRSAAVPASRRWWPVAAAAALVLAVGIPVLRNGTDASRVSEEATRYRGDANIAPEPVAPVNAASLAADVEFVWRTVPDARDYTVEALEIGGEMVFRSVTTDSTLRLPASLTADQRSRIAAWRVIATRNDGAQTRSALQLVGSAPRP